MNFPQVCAPLRTSVEVLAEVSLTAASPKSYLHPIGWTFSGITSTLLIAFAPLLAVADPLTVGEFRSFTHTPSQPARYGSIGAIDVTDKYVGVMAYTIVGTPPYPNAINVYSASSGELLHTLAPPPQVGNLNYNFGSSIAMYGGLAVVSASREHITRADGTIAYNAGAAYVYDIASGQLLHKLFADTPRFNDDFGFGVAIHGDTVAVGATGRAFLFDAKTGLQIARVDAPTARFSETFRTRVAISDSTLLTLGGRTNESRLPESVAFAYDLSTLTQPRELTPTDVELPRGPLSMAIDGNHAVITSYDFMFGAAYVFDANTGSQVATIKSPSFGRRHDGFGFSVDISDNLLLVGAPVTNGAAYLFDWTTGQLQANLVHSGPTQGHQFGSGVALSDRNAVVATSPIDGGPNAAFQYAVVPEPASELLATGMVAFIARMQHGGSLRRVRRGRSMGKLWRDSLQLQHDHGFRKQIPKPSSFA